MRYTVDGRDALEKTIASDMGRICGQALEAAGPANITALVLGGGYGRGEGGVYVVGGEERVYNDYDVFVVVPFTSRSRRKQVSRQLRTVKDRMEPECGIHVDFSPPMPASGLSSLPFEIMYMEAKAGHQVIYGPQNVFDAMPCYDTERPPLEEGARLLMNRGIGLLMAQMLLREGHALSQTEYEFAVRNMYKAMMAMGDCVLMRYGNYSPSYLDRSRRFNAVINPDVPEPDRLRATYESALAFKLRPNHALPEGRSLEDWLRETVEFFLTISLWFEGNRLGRATLDWETYAALPARLPELSSRERAKNLYRNTRVRAGGLARPEDWLLHPRDRILRRLPRLLAENRANPTDETLVLKLWENYG